MLHGQIRYVFKKTNSGARVKIETANTQALEAVHAFLRFQIVSEFLCRELMPRLRVTADCCCP